MSDRPPIRLHDKEDIYLMSGEEFDAFMSIAFKQGVVSGKNRIRHRKQDMFPCPMCGWRMMLRPSKNKPGVIVQMCKNPKCYYVHNHQAMLKEE